MGLLLLIAPESWPFTVALVVLLALAFIEGMGLLVGLDFSSWLDHMLPEGTADATAISDAWLGWLHLGKLPLLVILMLALTWFAIVGFTINAIVSALLGAYPPAFLAAIAAAICALPLVRASGGALARIMPRDETSAVTLDSLVGRVAIVVSGTARAGYPAEARVTNAHGQTHYVRVEPDDAQVTFSSGASVLLVKQISGTRFQAIANPRPDLL